MGGFDYPRKVVIDYIRLQTDLEIIYLFTLFHFEATLAVVAGRFLRVLIEILIRGLRDLWLPKIQLFRGMHGEVIPPSATRYGNALRIEFFLFFSRVANLFITVPFFTIRLRTHFTILKYI